MKPIKLEQAQLDKIWQEVPPDYYQNGTKNNILQKIWHTNKLNAVINQIGEVSHNSTLLDVGCASGWFLNEIRKKFPLLDCYGIDPYRNAIEYGTKIYPNIKLKLADAHKLPFDDNFFDYVICTEVLEHVENPILVLKEITRVTKHDASIILEMDTGNVLFKTIWYFWTHIRKGVWHEAHIQKFDKKILKETIISSGLKIQAETVFNFSMAVSFSCIKES